MARRFTSSSSQHPFSPTRPPQKLPEDFDSFIPTAPARCFGVPPPSASLPPASPVVIPSSDPASKARESLPAQNVLEKSQPDPAPTSSLPSPNVPPEIAAILPPCSPAPDVEPVSLPPIFHSLAKLLDEAVNILKVRRSTPSPKPMCWSTASLIRTPK
jgi:hypothetical protein